MIAYKPKQARESNRDAIRDLFRRVFGGLPSQWDQPDGVAKFRKWAGELVAANGGDMREHLVAIHNKRRACLVTNKAAWRIVNEECERALRGTPVDGGGFIIRMDQM